MPTLIPLDFNSLCGAKNEKINLSNYYLNYAFGDGALIEGMDITFYDEGWLINSNDIICLDATLRKTVGNTESWFAELKGRIYRSSEKPTLRYFTSFIGAETRRLAEDGSEFTEQKKGEDPTKDKLSGISCFIFAHGSSLPNFSNIVGMDANELCNFFRFAEIPRPELENGRYPNDALFVRGGANITRTSENQL